MKDSRKKVKIGKNRANEAYNSKLASLGLLMVTLALGCSEKIAIPTPTEPTVFSTSLKPKKSTAGIKGQIVWQGILPTVAGFRAPISPLSEHIGNPRLAWPNPSTPKINPKNNGLENAVVTLESTEPFSINAEGFPPIEVETNQFKMLVKQAGVFSPIGFVRQGDSVNFINRQDFFFSIRARGEAFFSIPLSQKNKPVQRSFPSAGVVTLTSGTGQFWMQSHLIILPHTFATRSDKDGLFEISGLPEGKHNFKVWLPNWQITNQEIDAETWEITWLEFAKDLEKTFSSTASEEPSLEVIKISGSDLAIKK